MEEKKDAQRFRYIISPRCILPRRRESSDPSIAVSCDHETYIPSKVWLMLCFDFRITLKVVCGNEIHERTGITH